MTPNLLVFCLALSILSGATMARPVTIPDNYTVGITVASVNGDLGATYGIRLDNSGNIYASDFSNSLVIRWPPNSTSNGSIVAGGTQGSGTWSLNYPRQIDFDPTFSFLHVVDRANHRIQMYNLVNTSVRLITVAGGHGPGVAPNQLEQPNSVCASHKTGALYIADTFNHRVQRWDRGSSAGVRVAGSVNGISDSSPTLMSTPYGVALDANETFLYVSEYSSHRVQRFAII
jgi:tripartite motif-containing protein 71